MKRQDEAKPIRLTKGYTAWVDAEDFARLNKHQWRTLQKTGVRSVYAYRKERGKTILMHREIIGAEKGVWVDHKDMNSLNNRKSNLRRSTPAQNLANTQARKGTSKYKGVSWDKERNKWQARLAYSVDGKPKAYIIGRFINEEDAARAYDQKAVEIYGEFARLNFPEE